MLFKKITGQKEIIKKLLTTVKDNRISHSIMFVGPEGSGSLALALAYAQYISCEEKQEDDSCGKCSSCVKYNKLIHPDLHFAFPVAGKKSGDGREPVSNMFHEQWREAIADNPYLNLQQWYEKIEIENKQGKIGKDESLEILRRLSLKSYESEYKIMIIWMAEKMNDSAANKLLKIIEEPPENTVFMLICETIETVLPTILSRVQMIKVPGIDNESLAAALKNRFNISDSDITNAIKLARGNMLEAENVINTGEEAKDCFERFAGLMRVCYSKKVNEMLSWVENISTIGREKQKFFIQYAINMIRNNFMLNQHIPEIAYLTSEEEIFSEKFHPFINNNNTSLLYLEFSRAQSDIERNGNPKIVFFDLSLKIMSLLRT